MSEISQSLKSTTPIIDNNEIVSSVIDKVTSNSTTKTNKRKKCTNYAQHSPKKPKISSFNLPGILPPERKVICFSGCTKELIEELSIALLQLGSNEYSAEIDDTTTHVVLGANMRTLKTIVAISRGLHLVRTEWILESMKANCWLKEENFGVEDWFPGANISQRAHEMHENLLFSSTTFFIGNGTVFPVQTLQRVLESLGGNITHIPIEADIRIDSTLPKNRKENSTTVTENWVFDSLVLWQKQNPTSYLPPANPVRTTLSKQNSVK